MFGSQANDAPGGESEALKIPAARTEDVGKWPKELGEQKSLSVKLGEIEERYPPTSEHLREL